MITTEILKNSLLYDDDSKKNINALQKAYDETGDYLLIELHVFNVGSYWTYTSLDYCQEAEQEAMNSGQIYICKDELEFLLPHTTLELFEL